MLRQLAKISATMFAAGALVAATLPSSAFGAATPHGGTAVTHHAVLVSAAGDISKIKHVVVIMQENRSFDHYFGTFPGANGIPTDGSGQFADSTCLDDILTGTCQKPYHSTVDGGIGGGHGNQTALDDIDGGAMDGFLKEGQRSFGHADCQYGVPSSCVTNSDVMSYHDAREIPNYWQYAQHFTLADRTFEYIPSWSAPSHLYMVSEWSAQCTSDDPMSCHEDIVHPVGGPKLNKCDAGDQASCPHLAWTDMTYLLHAQDKSWGYYVQKGTIPDCYEGGEAEVSCNGTEGQGAQTPSIWNPLPYFQDVKDNNQLDNIQDSSHFFSSAADGTLPAVSWVVPSGTNSEHPNPRGGSRITAGQAWVTSLVNAVMNGPDWDSTAIFVSWDDWGGWYDHVPVPSSAGIRVPMLVISPYAKPGYIDDTSYGLDSINRFIEDDFLGGQQLDPATDGRPDSRPDVEENRPFINDLSNAFDFNQDPLPPLVLQQHPLPGPPSCIDGVVCDIHYTTNLSPRAVQIGASQYALTVTGNGFQDGLQVSVNGVGGHQPVTVSDVSVVDNRTVQFKISVPRGSKISWGNIILTNPGGTIASCNGCLQVSAGPVITSMSPPSVTAGTSTPVTISGKNFATGAKVTSTQGIRLTGVSVQNATTITGTVVAPAGTPAGTYPLTVHNPVSVGGGVGSCTCMKVTAS